jgi:hypothetical protein
VISTGPRKAASTTSPDRLLRSVREKFAIDIPSSGIISHYQYNSYFSYVMHVGQARTGTNWEQMARSPDFA